MLSTVTRVSTIIVVIVAALVLAPLAADAQLCQCQQQDNGNGTVTMPPACVDGYIGSMQIVTGLVVPATIQIDVKVHNFANVVEVLGGDLGGTISTFGPATVEMQMTGTGPLAGFNRTIFMPVVTGAMHFGPRVANAPVQTFPGLIKDLQADIFGDPDFDILQFRSGTQGGFPSSGSSTLTRLGGIGTDFIVDSFFDIEYEIEFQGAPGSALAGMGGIHADFTRISICGLSPVSTEETSWGAIKARYLD